MTVGPVDPPPDGAPPDPGSPDEPPFPGGPTGPGALLVAGLVLWPVLAVAFVVRLDLGVFDGVYLAFILGLMPILAVAQLPMLSEVVRIERLAAYRSTALMLALLGLLGVLLGRRTVGLTGMGLAWPGLRDFAVWTGALLAFGLLLVGGFHLLTEALGIDESPLLRLLLPRTRREKAGFTLVSFAAGGGEEIAYRGYAIPVLAPLLGGPWGAVVFTSLAFGLLHAYQGTVGMARTGLLGAGLAASFVVSGTLWPAMAAHLLLNLAGGLWLGERFVGRGEGEN